MKVERIPATELGPELRKRWIELQESDPALASPFFRPEFTEAVARERDDIYVAVLSQGGHVGGFFPFQLGDDNVGRPVGLLMSNAQGVIAARDLEWDAVQLVKGCGLDALVLTHVPSAQQPLQPFHTSAEASFAIDLSDGWESYVEDRERDGSRVIKKILQAERRLERECGPIELIGSTEDTSLLDTLVTWKLARYDGGSLHHDWAVRACKRLLNERSPGFAGMLSALRVEDRVIALHMGMRSATRWNYWYPAYDPEYSRHSPGHILLLRMAQWAGGAGIQQLDLGKGPERYKRRFSNRETPIAEARVAASWTTALRDRIERVDVLRGPRAVLRRLRGRFA